MNLKRLIGDAKPLAQECGEKIHEAANLRAPDERFPFAAAASGLILQNFVITLALQKGYRPGEPMGARFMETMYRQLEKDAKERWLKDPSLRSLV